MTSRLISSRSNSSLGWEMTLDFCFILPHQLVQQVQGLMDWQAYIHLNGSIYPLFKPSLGLDDGQSFAFCFFRKQYHCNGGLLSIPTLLDCLENRELSSFCVPGVESNGLLRITLHGDVYFINFFFNFTKFIVLTLQQLPVYSLWLIVTNCTEFGLPK